MIELLPNSAHLHVLLNHVPTVGFGVGLALFIVALVRNNDELKRAGLVIFFIVADIAIATYVTGNAAEAVIQGRVDVPEAAIRAHEDAALLAFVFMEVTGFFAWLALWHRGRRASPLARWGMAVVLLLSVLTFALMARAANLGGDISHPEIRAVQIATPAADTKAAATGTARSLGELVAGQSWIWPAAETIHFVGLCMLFTVLLIVNLRILGAMKNLSLAAVHQLLPWGILGFGLNLITGMAFFIGNPGQYIQNVVFFWKIALVLVGGLNTLHFMVDDDVWAVRSGENAPFRAKMAAASALFVWVAVLFCGHMLPFLGDAF